MQKEKCSHDRSQETENVRSSTACPFPRLSLLSEFRGRHAGRKSERTAKRRRTKDWMEESGRASYRGTPRSARSLWRRKCAENPLYAQGVEKVGHRKRKESKARNTKSKPFAPVQARGHACKVKKKTRRVRVKAYPEKKRRSSAAWQRPLQ